MQQIPRSPPPPIHHILLPNWPRGVSSTDRLRPTPHSQKLTSDSFFPLVSDNKSGSQDPSPRPSFKAFESVLCSPPPSNSRLRTGLAPASPWPRPIHDFLLRFWFSSQKKGKFQKSTITVRNQENETSVKGQRPNVFEFHNLGLHFPLLDLSPHSSYTAMSTSNRTKRSRKTAYVTRRKIRREKSRVRRRTQCPASSFLSSQRIHRVSPRLFFPHLSFPLLFSSLPLRNQWKARKREEMMIKLHTPRIMRRTNKE